MITEEELGLLVAVRQRIGKRRWLRHWRLFLSDRNLRRTRDLALALARTPDDDEWETGWLDPISGREIRTVYTGKELRTLYTVRQRIGKDGWRRLHDAYPALRQSGGGK